MKAVSSIRNKIKKPSRSTVLFWAGWFLGPLALVLGLVFPSAQLVLDLIAVGGFALSGSQKIVGDREQRQQVEQERSTREAREQYIYDRTPEGQIRRNLEKTRTSMHMDRQKPHN